MAVKSSVLGGTDYVDGVSISATDLNDTNEAIISGGCLGEVKMFALGLTGALTKSELQSMGWAICDGTDIVTTQGITSANITGSAPDMQHKFIRMSNDETSGATGGAESEDHYHHTTQVGDNSLCDAIFGSSGSFEYTNKNLSSSGGGTKYNDPLHETSTETVNTVPPYYELVFFIKVKIGVSGY